jgi:uncharacterized protein GlcG (DUF336 family)
VTPDDRTTAQGAKPPAKGSVKFCLWDHLKGETVSPETRANRGCYAMNHPMFLRLVSITVVVGFSSTTPAFADDVLITHRLSAELANTAVSEVVASCARQGYSETAVVVDADGVRQAVLRGDRAGSHSLDSANDKAYTAASFKSDTSALVERAKTVPGFSALFTQIPHLVLFGGGIVIKLNDEVVGAPTWTRLARVQGSTRSGTV